MLYIVISLLAIAVGIALCVISAKCLWSDDVAMVVTLPFFLYGIISLFALFISDNKSDDLKRYDKAVAESHVVMETKAMDYDLFDDYIRDITRANRLIEDSKKYHDHWYLGPFFYKEIGELEPIKIDSLDVKLTF